MKSERQDNQKAGGFVWGLLAGLAFLIFVVAYFTIAITRQNGGIFTYALDDAYIHLAIARNLAVHGVWGITPEQFTSSSSSLLWTLLLAGVAKVFGDNPQNALWLNLFSAVLLLTVVYAFARRFGYREITALGAMLVAILVVPVIGLVFIGMEHLLHGALSLWFVYVLLRVMQPERSVRGSVILLFVLSALLVMARFEGAFLIFAASVLLALGRRMGLAVMVAVGGLLPIVVFGVVSVSHAAFFVPSTILLKSNTAAGGLAGLVKTLFYNPLIAMSLSPHLMVLLPVCIAYGFLSFRKSGRFWDIRVALPVLFIACALLHLQFINRNQFHRYDAYLMALAVAVFIPIAMDTWEWLRTRGKSESSAAGLAVLLGALLLFLPSFYRGAESTVNLTTAARNIYEQQYQMGRFLKQFYEGERVVANDIGAICYFADIKLLDTVGLGTIEIARAVRAGVATTGFIENLARQKDARIAVIYDDWMKEYGGVPDSWIFCGAWQISDNYICGGSMVSFYAVDEQAAGPLMENLRDFQGLLPHTVAQLGPYTRSGESAYLERER